MSTLRGALGVAEDNLCRARMQFRAPDRMNKEYGESGRTGAQILSGYEDEVRSMKEAIAAAEAL